MSGITSSSIYGKEVFVFEQHHYALILGRPKETTTAKATPNYL